MMRINFKQDMQRENVKFFFKVISPDNYFLFVE